jgi:hypothetical protein
MVSGMLASLQLVGAPATGRLADRLSGGVRLWDRPAAAGGEGARRALQLGLVAAALGAALFSHHEILAATGSHRTAAAVSHSPFCLTWGWLFPGAATVGFTSSLVGLVAARAPSALLSHTLMHARAALARIAEGGQKGKGDNAGAGSRRRATHFAHVNSLVGAALAVGAALGGVLSFERGVALMAASYGEARPLARCSAGWQRLHHIAARHEAP